MHWGPYAIAAGTWKESVHNQGYSEWIMFKEKIPVADYTVVKATPWKRYPTRELADACRKAGIRCTATTSAVETTRSTSRPKVTICPQSA